MFPAKVKHLLGLGNAADHRAGKTAATHDQAERCDIQGLFRHTNQGNVAIEAEQVEIGVDVVLGGDGIEDEIKATSVFLHLVSIAGDNDFISTKAQRVCFLAGGRSKDDN